MRVRRVCYHTILRRGSCSHVRWLATELCRSLARCGDASDSRQRGPQVAFERHAQRLAKINPSWLRDAELAPYPPIPVLHPSGASASLNHIDFVGTEAECEKE